MQTLTLPGVFAAPFKCSRCGARSSLVGAALAVTWRNCSPFASQHQAHWATFACSCWHHRRRHKTVRGWRWKLDVGDVVTNLLGGGGIDAGVLAPTTVHKPASSVLWQRGNPDSRASGFLTFISEESATMHIFLVRPRTLLATRQMLLANAECNGGGSRPTLTAVNT